VVLYNCIIFVIQIDNNKIDMAYTPKVGDYEYIIRRNMFWVMRIEVINEDGSGYSTRVAEFSDREEARRMVWEHNGWGTPKAALKPRWAR